MSSFCFDAAAPKILLLCLMLSGLQGLCAAQIRGAGTALTGERKALPLDPAVAEKRAYHLGTGDALSVAFRFTPEFNEDVVVGPDGAISLRATGTVYAEGVSVQELEAKIAAASASKLVKPEVAVTLKSFDLPHVFIAGEVNTPGRQDLRHPTTALQAILMCGGTKEDAALGRVLLFRRIDSDTAEVHVLKLSQYGRKARSENDMLLESGDMLLVRRDTPSHVERFIKLANLGLYINPLQNATFF